MELARQLRVTLNDLLGEPVLFEDEENNDDVPAVRDALMSPQRLSRTLFGGGLQPEYVDPEPVARVTEEAWNQCQHGKLHRLSAALDLGDVANVVERGQAVRPTHLPVERQVTHAIDLARALSMLARDEDALQLLLDAEQKAPQLVRHSSMVREVVRTMYRRSPVSNGRSSPLLGLAERCRAVR